MSGVIKTEGKILEVINRYSFKVYANESNIELNATISKHMKAYEGKNLNVGDSVIIEFSRFDKNRGRISYETFY